MDWKTTALILHFTLTAEISVCMGSETETLRCEAGNYTVGEDASVTCLFHRDVGRTMHHIYVTRYSLGAANNMTQVLICFRLHTMKLECRIDEGYFLVEDISHNLTLAIPEVKKHFAGRYTCGLVPPDGIPRNTCDLNVNGSALTCQAGSFAEGEAASVTCYFHKDIEKTIHHIYVVRYPLNPTETSTSALVCFRFHNKELACRTEAGYVFNGTVSHKLILEIPEMRKQFAGRYACQIVPPENVPNSTCQLDMKEPRSKTSTESGTIHIVVSSVVGSVALLLASVILGIFCYRKRKFQERRHRQHAGSFPRGLEPTYYGVCMAGSRPPMPGPTVDGRRRCKEPTTQDDPPLKTSSQIKELVPLSDRLDPPTARSEVEWIQEADDRV